ncbi:tumor necrosis factor receptor superfamily member 14-like isoform X2 [Antennarius striatus]|uniref:tumor necrosis factor receptor superfamily member 14-like isoform X2 n=1 Tax=Antennarius striatus TaxID=241820 RepID=UPI0035B28367
MMSIRILLTDASLLVLAMNVFKGHTLTCHRSEYQIGNECCPMCPAGSGLKINRPCTATSDTVCEPLDGFYCLDQKEESCTAAQKHRSCEPGQYISQNGTVLTDTVCSDCTDGTYSNGKLPSCLPHKECESMNLVLIKPGTVSTDVECGRQSSSLVGIVMGVLVSLVFIVIFVIMSCKLKEFRQIFKNGTAGNRRADMYDRREEDEIICS